MRKIFFVTLSIASMLLLLSCSTVSPSKKGSVPFTLVKDDNLSRIPRLLTSSYPFNPVKIVTSHDEMNAMLNERDASYARYGFRETQQNSFDKYDEAFFTKNTLVFILVSHGHPGHSNHRIDSVKVQGHSLIINVLYRSPKGSIFPCVMQYVSFVIQIKKEDIPDVTNIEYRPKDTRLWFLPSAIF